MKKLLLLILIVTISSCGKTKIDKSSTNESSSSVSTSAGGTSTCVSNLQCKAICDGGSMYGTKAECDRENDKNYPYKPYCAKLNACYSQPI